MLPSNLLLLLLPLLLLFLLLLLQILYGVFAVLIAALGIGLSSLDPLQ